jgi:hypothetical protein
MFCGVPPKAVVDECANVPILTGNAVVHTGKYNARGRMKTAL